MERKRRGVEEVRSLEDRIAEEAKRLREKAKSVPPGAAREKMIRKARQAETVPISAHGYGRRGCYPPSDLSNSGVVTVHFFGELCHSSAIFSQPAFPAAVLASVACWRQSSAFWR